MTGSAVAPGACTRRAGSSSSSEVEITKPLPRAATVFFSFLSSSSTTSSSVSSAWSSTSALLASSSISSALVLRAPFFGAALAAERERVEVFFAVAVRVPDFAVVPDFAADLARVVLPAEVLAAPVFVPPVLPAPALAAV